MKGLLFIISFLFFFPSFSQERVDTIVLNLQNSVKEAPTDSLKVIALLNLGVYQLRRDFNSVETLSAEILDLLKKNEQEYDVSLQRAEIFQQLGILNRKRANYDLALRYYLDAQHIFIQYKDSLNLSSNYHNIGNLYKYQKEFDKSIDVLKKAMVINRRLGIPKKIGDNYNIMAGVYRRIDYIDSASYYYDKAYEKFIEANYEEGALQVVSNKALLLIIQEKYEEALILQLEYLAYVEEKEKRESIANVNYSLAKTYNEMGQFENALHHVNRAIDISKREKMGRQLAFSYKRKSLSYYLMKDFENALEYYRKYAKVNDSVFNLQKIKEIRGVELEYKFKQEKVKDSIQFAEEKKNILIQKENQELKKKWYLTLFVITLLVTILIVFYGFKYFRSIWKRNKDKEAQLTTQIDQLYTKVSVKEEEVTALMKETLIHLRTKEKLAEDLSNLSEHLGGASLKSIIADLKADKLEDSKLLLLKKNIETLNYEFLKKLKDNHPSLTKTDIEVCSFIKLGLSRKEVANLRKTSLEAIKSTRFRLKKKLQLTKVESLDNYINSL